MALLLLNKEMITVDDLLIEKGSLIDLFRLWSYSIVFSDLSVRLALSLGTFICLKFLSGLTSTFSMSS